MMMQIGIANFYYGKINQPKTNFGSKPIDADMNKEERIEEANENFKAFLDEGRKIVDEATQKIADERKRLEKEAENSKEYTEKKEEKIKEITKKLESDQKYELNTMSVPDFRISLQLAEENKQIELLNIPQLAKDGDLAAKLILWSRDFFGLRDKRLSGENSLTADSLIERYRREVFINKRKFSCNNEPLVIDRNEFDNTKPKLEEYIKQLKDTLEKIEPSEELKKAQEEYDKAYEAKRQEILNPEKSINVRAEENFNKSEKAPLICSLIQEDLKAFETKTMPRQLNKWVKGSDDEDEIGFRSFPNDMGIKGGLKSYGTYTHRINYSGPCKSNLNPERIVLASPNEDYDLGTPKVTGMSDGLSGALIMDYRSGQKYFKDIKFDGITDKGEERFIITEVDLRGKKEFTYTLITGTEAVEFGERVDCVKIIYEDGKVEILQYDKRHKPYYERHNF